MKKLIFLNTIFLILCFIMFLLGSFPEKEVEQVQEINIQEVNAQADMGAIAQEDAESMQDPTAGLDPTAVAEAEDMLGGEQAPMI